MVELTPLDELFVHQIPEPLPNVAVHHHHWRESVFFVAHRPDGPGDVVILALAHYPARAEMDALQLGRIGGKPTVARFVRPYEGDPHTMRVGPVTVEVLEPYRRLRLAVEEAPGVAVALELTFEARTRPYALRRGTLRHGEELIWDQSHMVQSGRYSGTVVHEGRRISLDGWWGQRDHSWGIRDHQRCPLWIWLAVQLPDAMAAVWHWELSNGAPVFTDGCFAGTDGSAPVPLVAFSHDLRWVDDGGRPVDYGRDGEDVAGLEGRVELRFADGRRLALEAEGRFAQRYGPLGGGLNEMVVRTADGVSGTAIFEVTGAHHHRYFPIPRAEGVP